LRELIPIPELWELIPIPEFRELIPIPELWELIPIPEFRELIPIPELHGITGNSYQFRNSGYWFRFRHCTEFLPISEFLTGIGSLLDAEVMIE
jgi:hypothetical protein